MDISMQQSVGWFLSTTIPYWELDKTILGRVGTFRNINSMGVVQRQVWPCKDGFIFFLMMGRQQGAKTCRQLVKWMNEAGMANEFLLNFEWELFDMATSSQELIDKISQPIATFFKTRTKQEALDAAVSRSISLCPLMGNQDLLADPNLAARGFWTHMNVPALNTTIPYPKQFAGSSENDLTTRFPAPQIGEHNAEIFGELGLSPERIEELKRAGVI